MPTILLGNTAPIQPVKVDPNTTEVERVPRPDLGNTVTTFNVPNHIGAGEMLSTISSVFKSHHSDAKPAWVEGDDEVIVAALAREFGCPVGRPGGWQEGPVETQEPQVETQTITPADVATVPAGVATPTPTVGAVAVTPTPGAVA